MYVYLFFLTLLNTFLKRIIIIFVSPTRRHAEQHFAHSRAVARNRFDQKSNGARRKLGKSKAIFMTDRRKILR